MRGHRMVLLVFFVSLFLLEGPGAAQAPAGSASPPAVRTIHLRDFLAEVERSNLDLAASRFNVPVAEAQVALARLFPDPQLTAGIDALDLTDRKAPTATVYGLSQTIELGGKRGARIAEAKAGKTLAEAQLDDFFQSLRASAANAFIDALAARRVLALKRRTLEGVEKLVTATEHRLRVGDVGASALWQVNVEAERFRSEVLKAEGEVRAADLALGLFVGPGYAGAPARLQPDGELLIVPRTFDPEVLVGQAVERRSDVVVSLRSAEVARAHVGLAESNRWIDPTLAASITRSSFDAGLAAPASRTLGMTIGLPVPFSRLTHGELDAARASRDQAETLLRSARLRVEVELRQALARYDASARALAIYTGEIVTNADRALEATRYSYERGASRLIELLDAQRTLDEVHVSYVSALADHARALVTVQRAAGIWDIDF